LRTFFFHFFAGWVFGGSLWRGISSSSSSSPTLTYFRRSCLSSLWKLMKWLLHSIGIVNSFSRPHEALRAHWCGVKDKGPTRIYMVSLDVIAIFPLF
jgi:hypothetical protein